MATVLIVDDDAMTRRIFEIILNITGGFDVLTSLNVEEILYLGKTQQIDVVIMDICLDGWSYCGERVNGIRISQLLRQQTESRLIPILLVTACSMTEDREILLHQSGAQSYLSKPLKNSLDLIGQLRLLLDSS